VAECRGCQYIEI